MTRCPVCSAELSETGTACRVCDTDLSVVREMDRLIADLGSDPNPAPGRGPDLPGLTVVEPTPVAASLRFVQGTGGFGPEEGP